MATLARLLLLVASLFQEGRDAIWSEPEVRSGNGRFVAAIGKAAGQERVRDPLARWRLEVLEVAADGSRSALWGCPFVHGAEARRYLLSDDGTTLVQVVEHLPSRRPLVQVLREGVVVAALDSLGLEHARTSGEPAAWLEPDADAARLEWRVTDAGVWLALVLRARGGAVALVDLGTGELVLSERPADPVVVLPAPPSDPALRLESAYVSALDAPPYSLAGEPLELVVQGAYPTPNWNLMGFELARPDPERIPSFQDMLAAQADLERALEIVPRIAPPDGGPQAAVLEGFRSTATLHGLGVGRWMLAARGRDERRVEPVVVDVLPARLRLRLVVTGGLAGVEQRASLYAPGVLEHSDSRSPAARRAMLRERELARLESLLAQLPADPRSSTSSADVLVYDLGWWRDGRWRTLRADELSAEPAVRALVEELCD